MSSQVRALSSEAELLAAVCELLNTFSISRKLWHPECPVSLLVGLEHHRDGTIANARLCLTTAPENFMGSTQDRRGYVHD